MTLPPSLLALPALCLLAGCMADPAAAPAPTPAPQAIALAATAPPPAPRLSGSLAATGFGKMIATAVRSHPDVRSASYAIDSAAADLGTVSNPYIPAVSVGASAIHETGGTTPGSYATPYLRVTQMIFDGGISSSQRTAALAAIEAARNNRLVSASEVAYSAVEAYVSLHSAARTLALMQDNLSAQEEIGQLIETRSAAGAGGQSDALAVRSRIADARTMVIEAQTALERARANCIAVFGFTPDGDTAIPVPPRLLDRSDTGIGNAPRLLAINSSLAVSEAQLALAQAERMPQVSLGGTAKNDARGDQNVTFDLSVDYPFDTRGRTRAAVEKAAAEVNDMKAQKAALVRDIRRSLDYAEAARASGAARRAAAQEAVAANHDNVAAAREEFQIGRRSLLSLLDAQSDYVDAQENVITAEADMTLAGYEALSLTGDIVEATGTSMEDIVTVTR
ncbi:TolC family protein [Pseudooceanicola sp. CBS1P-1]|uniref:TolC family outer membrane protein n=1 Tax=Pseudooceanicola albus TaxID=2692189 RepID=A0A6L7GBW3_9RHOB|nr:MULTISPECIES: TolC family protein [Pseudooceanicola]MBT9386710.1 TolC family protein [Pseudooceanicola endophyticus]MXN20806.1 hypothetical protein [Pseudooceanicola albus]